MIPNLYNILQVDRFASKEEIKKAYRKLALQWYTDKNKSPEAYDKFIEINEELVFDEYQSASNSNSNKHKLNYKDPDLNNWTFTAKKQAEKYTSMFFFEFAKLIGEVIFETIKQGGTALIYAISAVVGASAIFSYFSGIYYGDLPQIILSIVFLWLSVIGFNFTSKRYKS